MEPVGESGKWVHFSFHFQLNVKSFLVFEHAFIRKIYLKMTFLSIFIIQIVVNQEQMKKMLFAEACKCDVQVSTASQKLHSDASLCRQLNP